ncbi:hypothetical protein IU459_35545 [Nocardia amamiensis]|uniref:Uncharacterized protein n=1 Tax=Nocardia amamiensis TaxID=404578 RepID=A0ABS0D1X4_9NOCA|nr:hypothetical protein [Nocardia amamiensis]MBF6302809.1 hypothetical protein [Nocardia amamiensis]
MLTDWLYDLIGHYLTLTDEVPRDGILDFSAGSLTVIGELLLERYDDDSDIIRDPDDRDPDDEFEFVPAVAAYLGETLLRAAGGRWDWLDDEPLVVPGDGLGLDPVAPIALIEQVVAEREVSPLTSVWEGWAAAVARAGGRPAKEPTDLDDFTPVEDAAHLAAWIGARTARFGEATPESLDLVEEAFRAAGPDDRELFADAVWHVGEVFRQGLGGRWTQDAPGPVDAEKVHVRLVGPGRARVTPSLLLAASRDQPGHLRRYYALAD